MKKTVIQRLREAQIWCAHNGAPYEWMRQLFADAAQELQSESGSLWLQWQLPRQGHVRVFVEGEMGIAELDSLLGILQLQRSFAERRSESPLPSDAVGQMETEEP